MMSRRGAAARALLVGAAAMPATQALVAPARPAGAFGFSLLVPEQTAEEAEGVVKYDVTEVVKVRRFIESGSWKELQLAVRASAANLKQDLYSIIQAKPGAQRPELRRLYSKLFNNVTDLDYAARDKNEAKVRECYDNIITALDEIFSKIY